MNVTANTLLINVDTLAYPVYLNQVRTANPNFSFAAEPSEEIIANLGYAVVHPTEQPVGDVVTEGTPEFVDGVFKQTWTVRDFTPEELEVRIASKKSVMSAQVDVLRERAMAYGFDYDFGGDIGVKGVQLRDQDKTNLVALRVIATDYVQAGAGDTTMVFRTRENINVTIAATTMIDMTNHALANVNSIYAASWVYKDQIEAAKTLSEFPTLPDELTL